MAVPNNIINDAKRKALKAVSFFNDMRDAINAKAGSDVIIWNTPLKDCPVILKNLKGAQEPLQQQSANQKKVKENLSELLLIKESFRQAIIFCGVDVDTSVPLADYGFKINQITL
jgi:hypothetical protein